MYQMYNIQKTSSIAIPQELKNTCLTNIFRAPAMMPSPATAIKDVNYITGSFLEEMDVKVKNMSQM